MSLRMLTLITSIGVLALSAATAQEALQPFVYEAVEPIVVQPLAERVLRLAPTWQPGDPVIVVEDLKERVEQGMQDQQTAPEEEQVPNGQESSPEEGQDPENDGEAQEDATEPEEADVDVRDLPAVDPFEGGDVREVDDLRESDPSEARERLSFSAPVTSFDGIPATGYIPPDTVGDIGPNHYIQMVNSAFAIYDRNGVLLAGPAPINALWSGFGGPCESENHGDPIVQYDHLADRWLISQFALPGGDEGLHECVAISRTADPVSGGWFLYDFPTVDQQSGSPVFPDYPKIAVWPDGYYMGTQRGFPNGGLDVWVFERDRMLSGDPAQVVQFAVPAPSLFLMPSDLDGPAPPPGTPNFFARQVDGERFGGADRFEIFAFSVDWSNPAASTFTQVASLPTASFDSVLCSASLLGACIPQPGTAVTLETLTVWPMWRLQYRNHGTEETLVANHTVDANGRDLAGIRWYELRRSSGGSWTIAQQSTYAPDDIHRWMGSIAMDQEGNIAIGYSVSSDSVFPGIRYAARQSTDPPGTLPQEVTLVTGNGSQTHGSRRWGNYSSMNIDPLDDCTFWYTTEYYDSTSAAGWKTHVSSFRSSTCGAPSERPPRMYAAKFICGTTEGEAVAPGRYFTAINVHNPSDRELSFRKKFAIALPSEEPGPVSEYYDARLGPDEAFEIDCPDVREHLEARAEFVKGFVVLESSQPLDVVAVYTAAGESGFVTTLEVERVPERQPGTEGQPDLLPTPDPRTNSFCRLDDQGRLIITVDNQGDADAAPSTTRFTFAPTGSVDVPTPRVPAGGSVDLPGVDIPGGCFDPDCDFRISVDATNLINEREEGNNDASGSCIG